MADKKKKGRRAYLSDYTMNVSGEYVYTGDWYTAQMDRDFGRFMGGVMGMLVLSMTLLVGVGCLSTGTTSGAFYVTLPHVLAIVLCAVCIYDCSIIAKSKGNMKTHQYQTSVPRLNSMSIAGAVCAFAAAAGQLGYILLAGSKATRAADMVFMIGCTGASMLLFGTFSARKQIKWLQNVNKL